MTSYFYWNFFLFAYDFHRTPTAAECGKTTTSKAYYWEVSFPNWTNIRGKSNIFWAEDETWFVMEVAFLPHTRVDALLDVFVAVPGW